MSNKLLTPKEMAAEFLKPDDSGGPSMAADNLLRKIRNATRDKKEDLWICVDEAKTIYVQLESANRQINGLVKLVFQNVDRRQKAERKLTKVK